MMVRIGEPEIPKRWAFKRLPKEAGRYPDERPTVVKSFEEVVEELEEQKEQIDRMMPLLAAQEYHAPSEVIIQRRNIPPGTVTPDMTDFDQHQLSGTFTDNSPSAGYVSWSGVKIVFLGTTYGINDGNTNQKYIYWQLSNPGVFQTANTFPGIEADDLVVAINESGVHRLVMMRGGLISRSLVDNLAINADKLADLAVELGKIANGAVDTEKLADAAVEVAKIAPQAVTTEKLAGLAVTEAKLANLSVALGKIQDGAVNAQKLADAAVEVAKIKDGAVQIDKIDVDFHIMDGIFSNNLPSAGYIAWSGVKIRYGGVTYSIADSNSNKKYIYWDKSVSTTGFQTSDTKPTLIAEDYLACINISGTAYRGDFVSELHAARLRAESITADEIAANAIIAAKIAAGAVETDKLAAQAVTAAKIAADTITAAQIAAGAIGTDELAANAVTAAKIAADTITANEIAAGAIGTNELLAGAVTAVKIAASAIETDKLAAQAVTAAKIAADTITAAQIAAGAINTDELAANSVVAGKIYAGAVTTEKIYAGAVTSDKISVATLDAIAANMGLLAAGEIRLGAGTPGVDFTGIRIYKSGSEYRVAGYNNNVLQTYLDSDGALRAGGGDLVLDDDGMGFPNATNYLDRIAVKWLTSGWLGAHIVGYCTGAAPNRVGVIELKAIEEGVGNAAVIRLRGGNVWFDLSQSSLQAILRGADFLIYHAGKKLQFVDSNTEIWKDASGNLTLKDAIAGTKTLAQLANYQFYPLTTPWTSTNWDGDDKGDTTGTLIDVSVDFGQDTTGIVAYAVCISARGSGSGYFTLAGTSAATTMFAVIARPSGSGVYDDGGGVVAANVNGDFFYASSACDAHWIRIGGYWKMP